MLLINGSHLKAIIADSNWYLVLINAFNCNSINEGMEDGDNENENNQIEEDDESEPVDDQILRHAGNANASQENVQRHITQNVNLPVVTCPIMPSSNEVVMIDLETNEDG